MSTGKRHDALREVDEIIGRLAEPLSEQRRKDGWTEEARARNLEAFKDVREDLRAGRTPSDSAHLLRNADDWGVARGDILDLVARLTLLLDLERADPLTTQCRCSTSATLTGNAATDYARGHLKELSVDYDNWIVQVECPETGARWELRYTNPDYHGGGEPVLSRTAAPRPPARPEASG